MNRAVKATFLSGLVFPGAGQIFLERYLRGILFIVPVLIGLVIIMFLATSTAITLVPQLNLEKGMPDIQTLFALAHEATPSNSLCYRWCLAIIVGCWLFSSIDAWRLGKQLPPPLPRTSATTVSIP